MLCEGCEGDGAGDCTCAFTAGTAVARIGAVRNGVHVRIIHSPIDYAAHIARPAALEAILRGDNSDKSYLGRGFQPKRGCDLSKRHAGTHMEPGSGTLF